MTVATAREPVPAERLGAADSQARLEELLADLYRRQLAVQPGNHYLRTHNTPRRIAKQVRTFHWYRPHLPQAGAILDWGCRHAPVSCLLRAALGDRHELHNCDFVERDEFAVFHDYADAAYTRLQNPFELPYEANAFAAVIAAGVLEHVAMDGESLKELYRVLKPGGLLVITDLPNWLSHEEWMRRVLRRREFHRRLYGLGETKQLLKHHGFYPFVADYHSFFWQRTGLPLAPWLARLVPIQMVSSTLFFLARKMMTM